MKSALGIVFSNLHDKNIKELTAQRTFASVPFGGRYRLIDFVLSSMVNSGIQKVGIITKSNYQSLMDHVGSGKSWDLARKNGGLLILPPYGSSSANAIYTNRLEALQSIMSYLRRSKEDYVVASDCDVVANVNYADVIDFHEKNNAEITLIYRKTADDAQGQRCLIDTDKTGRVKKFSLIDCPVGGSNVYANMMVIGREFLIHLLETAHLNNQVSFSRDILSKQADQIRIYGYCFNGYLATIDGMASYFRHNTEMLDKNNRDALFLKDSPIFTKNRDSAPTVYSETAIVSNCLIADGCVIEGTVKDSVLFRGVHVAKGAVITNSILMQDTVVSRDAELGYVVADKNVIIKEKRKLYGCDAHPFYIGKNSVL